MNDPVASGEKYHDPLLPEFEASKELKEINIRQKASRNFAVFI